MALKDIEKDLHKKDSEFTKREHNKTVYNVWQSKEPKKNKDNGWQHIKDELVGTRIKAIVIGTVLTMFASSTIIVSSFFVIHQRGFFSQDRVSFEMSAAQKIDSNVATEVEFVYINDNRADLENAQIKVNFGDCFVPEENQDNFERASDNRGAIIIGKIKGGQKNKIILKGQFVGPKDVVADVSGTLRYTPEKTNLQYELQARTATEIASSPVSVDISGPQEVVSGNLMDMSIIVKNTSNNTLSKVKVVLKSPKSFVMQNASPEIVSKNTWLFDSISPHSEQRINIRGILTAPPETVQIFQAEIGSQETESEYVSYAQGKYAPRMQGVPIIMHQAIVSDEDGIAYAGERLQYEVTFTNSSNMSLRDAVASIQFDTKVLDFSQLQLYDGGDYDAVNKKIIWKASDVEGLAIFKPKDTIKVRFNLPVLEKLPVESSDDYHFSIVTVAVIDSADIPSELKENKTILSNALSVPVGAKILFKGKAQFESGAKPLKVGDKTIYEIVLSIDNINNDLANVVVKAPLPTYVNFEKSDDVSFNDRTNVITWDIGDIVHGAGITSDRIQATFSVGIIPSVDQIEEQPIIVKDQVLTAQDKFTGIQVRQENSEINTQTDNQEYRDGVVIP
jgi:hypothetical protein